MKSTTRRPAKLLAGSLLLPVLFVPLGCADDDGDEVTVCDDVVVTETDDSADFSAYTTFAVLDGAGEGLGGAGNSAEIPPDIAVNLETANDEAAAQLVALGLTQVDADTGSPDLLVFSAAAAEEEQGTYWQCVPGYSWWGWTYVWDPCAWLAPVAYEYTVGTLLVGVADALSEQPVFGGLVRGILECSDDIDARIEAAVEDVFEDYPAGSEN